MSVPKVSVIIPFFRGTDWLAEAVESALGQSYGTTEIIVVNDGSPEDLTSFLQSYGDRIRYFTREHEGPGAARNFGIERASGDYIAFLDSDDLWRPDKLEKQVCLMETTKAAWSHTGYALFHDRKPYEAFRTVDVSGFRGKVFPRCLISSAIATPCVMVRTSCLKEDPRLRFSETMRYGQDGYLWFNLALAHPLLALPDVLTDVRDRGRNAARRVRAHLYAKGGHWEYLRRDPARYFGPGKMDRWTRFAYTMCFHANNAVERLERKGLLGDRGREAIAGGLYLVPYVLLKAHYHLVWKKRWLE